jgi:hypothetical protein
MGSYVFAGISFNTDSIFKFDTIGTHCIWDITGIIHTQVNRIDTIVVKSARLGHFGDLIPKASHVSIRNNSPKDEVYFYINDTGNYITGMALNFFCDTNNSQLISLSKDRLAYRFPYTLNNHNIDSFIWTTPTCGQLDTITQWYDSTYIEQKETHNDMCIASGNLYYNNEKLYDALLTKHSIMISNRLYNKNSSDTTGWRVVNEFTFETVNYSWRTNFSYQDVIYIYSWGSPSQTTYFMPTIINTGLNSFKNSELISFPNPVQSYLNIRNINETVSISIFDLRGRPVHVSEIHNKNINVEHLPQGMYILQAHGEDGRVYTTKFVKE